MTLKRLFCIVFAMVFLAGCTNKEATDNTQEEVEGLKGSKIATIQTQKDAIQASLDVLQAADNELKSYIQALQNGLTALTGVSEEEFAAALTKLNALSVAEVSLARSISEVQSFAAQQSTGGWIATSFLTLEKENALLVAFESIRLLTVEAEDPAGKLSPAILQNNAAARAKMMDALAAAEASVKGWVNKEIAGYYSIAQMEAKLRLLEAALAGVDGEVAEEISSLRQELNSACEAMLASYRSAISDAITANKGVINEKVATAIESATNTAQTKIDALGPRIDSLEARIAAIEASLSALVGSLESVVVIPEYSDGSVMVKQSNVITIRFEVYPLQVAQELAAKGASAFSLDYLETETKGQLFASIPITDISFDGQVLSITADCASLSEEIRTGVHDLSVRLRISDGKTACSSDYFRMFYEPLSIFRDDLFEEYVDQSGVKSYLLKSGLGEDNWDCSQSNYFNTRSMTNDERFLFFFGSNKDFVENQRRVGMIIDLKTRQIYKITGCAFSCCPYIDVENDVIYYGTVVNNKTGGEFYRRDLLVDPSVAIKLATLPSYLIPTDKTRPLQLLATHLTLTSDKQKALLDMHIHDSFVYGMIDLYKGTFEEWGRTSDYQLNHGQINPTDDNMIMMAASSYTSRETGATVYLQKDPDGLYPRIQIATKTVGGNPVYNRYTMVPDITSSRDGGYASHERWDESGKYVYWCSDTPCIRALSEARNMSTTSFTKYATPSKASHCFFSKDRKLITYDDQSPDYYRSCRWKVQFYNIKTKKEIKIHTLMPALVPKADVTAQDGDSDDVKTAKSKLAQAYQNWHTDPHPQFNCNDKYIICTVQRPDKTIRLGVTPVDQLLEMTK